jgi:hypothetical protein
MGFYSILMPRTVQIPSPQNVFILKAHEVTKERPGTGVGQDKIPPRRLLMASVQPLTADTTAVNRPKHHGSEKRRTEHLGGRVPPHIKSEVVRIAKVHGWTESKAVATLLEQAITQRLGEQLGVMLKQAVQDAVKEEYGRQSNRQTKLTFLLLFVAEQIRLMVTNIYRIAVNFNQDKFYKAMKELKRVAKKNVLKPTKDFEELLAEWKAGENAGQQAN